MLYSSVHLFFPASYGNGEPTDNALNFFKLGVSWGGHESLVMPAEMSINQAGSPSAAVDFGVSPRLVRLYVGLEEPTDLWNDMERALKTASPNE